MSGPDVSVVIVSWNVCALLRSCLHALLASDGGDDLEIIVVDGGSADGSTAMVREEFPSVQLLAQTENVGFPRGNNIGLAAAQGRYLFLLNPDTVVQPDTVATLLAYMDAHAEVGVAGAQLRFPDGRVQSSRRRFPTFWTGVFESTWLEPLAPRGLIARYRLADIPDDAVAAVDWLMGACLFVRREVVATVGGMDEAYFMYSEELDWCRRIRDAGWQVHYVPTTFIIHYEGKSSEQAVTARHVNFQRAKLRYFRKFHGAGVAGLLRAVLLVNYGWQLLLEGAKGLLGHKRALRRQRVAAYWAVLKTGLPPAGQ